jgi:hypothetical protein
MDASREYSRMVFETRNRGQRASSFAGRMIESLGVGLLLFGTEFVPAYADDGSGGDCHSTPQEQMERFAAERASELHWPLVRVSVDETSKIEVGGPNSSIEQATKALQRVVASMAIVTVKPSTKASSVTLARLGSSPDDQAHTQEYQLKIFDLVRGKKAFAERVRWEFSGLSSFDTIAVFIPPDNADHHVRLIFEPVLDVSGSAWKLDSWRTRPGEVRLWYKGCRPGVTS